MEARNAKIKQLIADHLGMEAANLTEDKKLIADLGCDSLDNVEILMAIEDEFAISLDDQEALKCVTVADVCDLVGRTVAAQAG
jgi:acyl carrier protein